MKNQKVLIICLLTAFFVLSAVPVIRHFIFSDTLIGEQAYYHKMLAENLPKDATTYHYLLHYMSYLGGYDVWSKILPIIFGVLSVYLFYLLLSKFIRNNERVMYTVLISIVSPVFIYTFTTSSPNSLRVFSILLGFFMFLSRNEAVSISSVAVFLLAAPDYFTSILIAILLATYYFFERKSLWKIIAFVLVLFGFNVIVGSYLITIYSAPPSSFIEALLSDFGNIAGLSLFTIIFFFMGIAEMWKETKFALYPFIALVIFSLYLTVEKLIFLNFFVAIFAGSGLMRLVKKEWKVTLIKELMVFLLICGLVFSSVSAGTRMISSDPSHQKISGFEWLGKHSSEGNIVFSQYKNGFLIESVSGRKPLLDDFSMRQPEFSSIIDDSEKIMKSRVLENTEAILQKYNISYILFDAEMKKSLEEDDGLLFVLGSSKFRQVFYNNEIWIWKYEP